MHVAHGISKLYADTIYNWIELAEVISVYE